jgi:hypothetical protein
VDNVGAEQWRGLGLEFSSLEGQEAGPGADRYRSRGNPGGEIAGRRHKFGALTFDSSGRIVSGEAPLLKGSPWAHMPNRGSPVRNSK